MYTVSSTSATSTRMIRVIVEGSTSFLKLNNDPTENLRLLAAKTNQKARHAPGGLCWGDTKLSTF